MDTKTRLATGVWFPKPHEVELRQELLPEVGQYDVRIRTIASALSHGTEMLVYRGYVSPELNFDLPTLGGSFAFPIKYGYASVGRVIEIGSEVRSLCEGDLVFVHHPHQTEYIVPESLPVRLPQHIEPEYGVFLANIETALNVMLDAGPRLGEQVIVFGQGVVGLLVTQLLRRTGVGLILAVEPVEKRRDLAKSVGADVVLAPKDNLRDAVYNLTNDIGADLVIEASGNGLALQQAIECAAFQGTIVVCSWYGTKTVNLDLGGAFHRKRLRLVSSQVSTIDPALQPRWNHARRLAVARDLLINLQLLQLISHRIPFKHAAEAYRLVDLHPEATVQVILTYGDGDV